jgi:hypothetical protein
MFFEKVVPVVVVPASGFSLNKNIKYVVRIIGFSL